MRKGRINWVSSVDESNYSLLKDLDQKMSSFYSKLEARNRYNQMIKKDRSELEMDEITDAFTKWVEQLSPKNILEIGCGEARIRNFLNISNSMQYTGIDVSTHLIEKNKQNWPNSDWEVGSIYDLCLNNLSYDLVYSFFVIEHLVFPKQALEKMYNLVKRNGWLVIVCPDFPASKIFPSQFIGLSSLQSTKLKIRNNRILDAIVGYYDSKFNLKRALKKISKQSQKFIINLNPICLHLNNNEEMWADCDAIYLSNKQELEEWGKLNNMNVYFPSGKEGHFHRNTFIALKKND